MLNQLILYILAVLAVALFPGPDMLFIINQSLQHGKMMGIAAALGICAGCFIHILALSIGLSTLVINSTVLFTLVRYTGACYLLYIGIRSMLSKRSLSVNINQPALNLPWKKIFVQGFLTNLLNPKVALFFLAFLPQFVQPHLDYCLPVQFLVLGLIFNAIGTANNLAVALFFGTAKRWLLTFPSVFNFQQKITGAILVGVGLQLALFH